MSSRLEPVRQLIQIAQHLFQSERLPEAGRKVAAHVFYRLEEFSDDGVRRTVRYPACDWLDAALAPHIEVETEFSPVARTIKSLEPYLGWSRRTSGRDGSVDYVERHVHGMICGPGGAESRYDVQLGFSIMAPQVRYPDHSHPPEEAYVLLTPGEFRQLDGEWFDPGIGGGIRNAPSSQHAMKSGSSPFLALWCLLT
jgi:hypothetical protein